ncbi:MAG: hypothetical protein QOE00_1177 [Ilumatobacteraceae bacterium]
MTGSAAERRAVGRLRSLSRLLLLPLMAVGMTSCDIIRDHALNDHSSADDVASVAGWTRIALTTHYLLVVNVLPSETMFTDGETMSMRPTVGEAILDGGVGNPTGLGVRHVEAHVYDRATGLPLSNIEPTIRVFNRTTGDHVDVPPTLMQDVVVGSSDIHYGNNVPVRGDSDISLAITVGNEEVTVDGHLD